MSNSLEKGQGLYIGETPVEGRSYIVLGCYITRWGRDEDPTYAFRRAPDVYRQAPALLEACKEMTLLLQATVVKYVSNGTILTDAERDRISHAWSIIKQVEEETT